MGHLDEMTIRARAWTRARTRGDRRWWPTPAAAARALLRLAAPVLVRARAQTRLLAADHREFFALMRDVERIADERFYVVCDGDATRVHGPLSSDDPRSAVISRAAALAGISRHALLAEADQQELELRKARRSHVRGLELAERFMAGLPKPKPRAPTSPLEPRRWAARRLFEPCGDGCFEFIGGHETTIDVDVELLFDDDGDPLEGEGWQ